jgi:broad-specificity NMP kinase
MQVILEEAKECHPYVYEVDSSGKPEQATKQILAVLKKESAL